MEDEPIETIPFEREINDVVPCIFDAPNLLSEIPEGFNAVRIILDGRLKGDLDWKAQIEAAEQFVDRGYFIFWDLELGLFDQLEYPITHQTQYLSLGLSVEHFRDTVCEKLSEDSIGVCLYRGSADFSKGFVWDQTQKSNFVEWLREGFDNLDNFNREIGLSLTNFEEIDIVMLSKTENGKILVVLFCRDVVIGYLDLLSSRVPDFLSVYLLIDSQEIKSPVDKARILSKDHYERYKLAIRDPKELFRQIGDLVWEVGQSNQGFISKQLIDNFSLNNPIIGICMPGTNHLFPSLYQPLEKTVQFLLEKNLSFRFISEILLTQSWDGLDYLIYSPEGLGAQGRRKLLGFCAAGGVAVSVGGLIGLPNEISIGDFIELQNQL